METYDTFEITFAQKGTDNRATLTVEVPLGWTVQQTIDALRWNSPQVRVIVR